MNEERLVSRLSEILAVKYGICRNDARKLRVVSALHDIGKCRIDKSILYKPGKLSTEEFEIIKNHTKIGAEMLNSVQGDIGLMAQNVCLYHHENWQNNGGYWGMRLRDLPPYISVVALCDVYVALRSHRVYKTKWSIEKTIDYIRARAGTQFNPALVKILIELVQGGNADICIQKLL
jgi:HD-GYP domain-containing protein (c-di-GMP phosphodiesterase class II)